jgi:Mg-chelatase subunit ChlD
VLVVVIAVDGMPVPVVHVVDVLIVRHRLVAAVRAVLVAMPGVRQVWQRVLVIVAVVRCVGVPFVHIVDVSLALHARVAAARAVLVVVVPVARVGVVVGCCH